MNGGGIIDVSIEPLSLVAIISIGAGVGFLGGLLGKGGSAIATPALLAIGLPPAVALASPLPATVPGTLVAANRYRHAGFIDRRTLTWSIGVGVPATIMGAAATRWIDAGSLVTVTEILLVAIGVRLILTKATVEPDEPELVGLVPVVAVAAITGVAAGLLANSGGFLLAPLFVTVLGMAIKPALGTSLAVASVLAVPASVIHLLLGHLDLTVVIAFALGAVPLSSLGARVALKVDSSRLERGYGLMLVIMGGGFLVAG